MAMGSFITQRYFDAQISIFLWLFIFGNAAVEFFKFIYPEKATKFLRNLHPSFVLCINFVAFSEYMNFKWKKIAKVSKGI